MKFNLLLACLLCFACRADAAQYGDFITRGPSAGNMFALTFDDGPGDNTEAVLAELSAAGVKGTFFMLGSEAKQYPKKAAQVAAAGHLIGNHTYSHANFNKVPEAQRVAKLSKEITDSSDAIFKATGVRTQFLRIPYGVSKAWVFPVAKKGKHIVANWTYGADWYGKPKEELLKGYKTALRPGAILLMHDGGKRRDTTVWLVRQLLIEAKKRKLKAVRLDVLLGIDLKKLDASAQPNVVK